MEQKQYTVLIYTLYYGTDKLPDRNIDRIKGLNRDNVLRFLIQIKIAVAQTQGKNITHPFIRLLIKNLPKDHGSRLASMLVMENQAYFLTTPVIVNQIIADILNEPTDAEIPDKNHVEYFALALLELIMIYNDHHFRAVLIGNRPDNHDLVWEFMQMQNINGNNPASFVRNGIIKHAIFFEFLKSYLGDKYDEFEQQLSKQIGIKALTNSVMLYIQLQITQNHVSGTDKPLIIIGTDDELYPVIHELRLVIDVQNKEGNYDCGRLMMHPFLKLSDQRLYLTGTHDFSLITDKGWEFFLFTAGKIGAFIPEIKNVNSLLSFLGYHYAEKFLMGKIFAALNRTGLRVIPSDDTQTPDFTLILNETDIFIIEVKAVALNYKTWQDQNLPAFKTYLDEQFVKGKKGVIQLHKCLKNLAERPEELFGLRTPLKKLKIYPVIIYTEPHLTIAAVNDYIIENSPALNNSLSEQFQRVMPVTMIHHDFFIENFKVLRQDKSILKKAIVKYHQTVADRKRKYKKFNSTANYINAMQSFDNLIAENFGLYEVPQDIITEELKPIFDSAKSTQNFR
jgi:hypothetical protein